jgi:hypothetical protein
MGFFGSIFGDFKRGEDRQQSAWPFKAPRTCAAFTMRQVVDGKEPILRVVHDDDGDWQFIGASDASEEDAAIVGLGSIYDLDPSIGELADLPPGWQAIRDRRDGPWAHSKLVDPE